jgi:hypothetical protein
MNDSVTLARLGAFEIGRSYSQDFKALTLGITRVHTFFQA